MTMDVKSEPLQKGAGGGAAGGGQHHECAGCKKKIAERFMLKALDMFWHEDCLKCACCDCRLGEVGSTLFTKANLILCKRDYLRLFGTTGYCSACSKMIPAFEMVMRARGNVYHLECFACQQCNHRFCVGDRFYLVDNKILCEYDYEERLVFASMPYNYNSIAHIKRQTQNLAPPQLPLAPDDVSSGALPNNSIRPLEGMALANGMNHSANNGMNGGGGGGSGGPMGLNNGMGGGNPMANHNHQQQQQQHHQQGPLQSPMQQPPQQQQQQQQQPPPSPAPPPPAPHNRRQNSSPKDRRQAALGALSGGNREGGAG